MPEKQKVLTVQPGSAAATGITLTNISVVASAALAVLKIGEIADITWLQVFLPILVVAGVSVALLMLILGAVLIYAGAPYGLDAKRRRAAHKTMIKLPAHFNRKDSK